MRKLSILLVFLNLGLGFVIIRAATGQTDPAPAAPLGSGFTYQGRLDIDGVPADGVYDFRFILYNAAGGGSQVGNTISMGDVTVTGGLFSVALDFGAGAFNGEARWLEIAVRAGNNGGAYSILSPRQQLTAAPYAIHATEAGSAPWSGLSGVPAGFADGADGVEYANVVVVAKSGGDFSSIQPALNSIVDASAGNPYLVYVAPGVYMEQVTLKEHLTLEGAGEGATIIRWMGGSENPLVGSGSATLIGADNATIRHLTVESDGTGQDYAVAIHNENASPTMNHVSAIALGGFGNLGLFNYFSSARITNVSITASGSSETLGVFNHSSIPMMTNVTVTASGGTSNNWGVYNYDSSPTIQHSVLEGSTHSIYGVHSRVKVANSQLIGPVDAGLTCFNNYDADLNPVTCP